MKTKIVILLMVLFTLIQLQVNAQGSNLIRLKQIEPIPATVLKAQGINTTYGLFPNGSGGVTWRAITAADVVGVVGGGTDISAGGTISGMLMLSTLNPSTTLELDGNGVVIGVAKNTAYNANFGTANNQVARGDHAHSGVYQPVLPSTVGASFYKYLVNDNGTLTWTSAAGSTFDDDWWASRPNVVITGVKVNNGLVYGYRTGSVAQSNVTALSDSLLRRYTKPQADKMFYSESEAEDIATNFYNKVETDQRYISAINAEDANMYYYTKTQVDAKIDSLWHLFLDYNGANPPDVVNPPTSTIKTGLISVWEFDETAGTTAADAAGGHAATLYNGAAPNQTGKIGKCVLFDGVNDYARVNSTVTAFDNLTGSYSISIWLRIVSEPASIKAGIIFKGIEADPTTWADYGIVADPSGEINGCNIRAINEGFLPDYLYPDPETHFPISQWHHIVVTYDEGSKIERFYVDGVQKSMQSVTGTISSSPSYLTFGSLGGSNYLNFLLDQTAIWNRAINVAEVQTVFSNGNGKAFTSW